MAAGAAAPAWAALGAGWLGQGVQAAGQGAGWLDSAISCSQPGVPSSLILDAAVCSAVAALLANELEEAALSQADLARFVAQPGWEGEEVAGLVARVKALAPAAALSASRRVTLLRRINALLLPRVVAPAGVADKPAAPLAAVAPGERHKRGKPACAQKSAGLRGFSSRRSARARCPPRATALKLARPARPVAARALRRATPRQGQCDEKARKSSGVLPRRTTTASSAAPARASPRNMSRGSKPAAPQKPLHAGEAGAAAGWSAPPPLRSSCSVTPRLMYCASESASGTLRRTESAQSAARRRSTTRALGREPSEARLSRSHWAKLGASRTPGSSALSRGQACTAALSALLGCITKLVGGDQQPGNSLATAWRGR